MPGSLGLGAMRHEVLRCAMRHEVYRDGPCIMKYRFRQAGNRFLGSLKGLQIRALGLIPASSDAMESGGRQMKQC